MGIIETLQALGPLIGIIMGIINNRSAIYNRLSKSKIGLWIMLPIMGPYVIWGLYKLYRDQDFLELMERANQQKKITDYFKENAA